MDRLEANMEIMEVLDQYLQDNPEQRFGQALQNLNIVKNVDGDHWVNGFYEESEEVLDRITEEKEVDCPSTADLRSVFMESRSLECLTDKECSVLNDYLFRGKEVDQIAEKYNYTRERIKQVLKKIKRKLDENEDKLYG